MYEYDWWNMYKTDKIIEEHLHESFPYKMPLKEEKLLKNIKSRSLLVKFNVILKYPRISEKHLLTFRPTSKTLMMLEMTLVRL